MNSDDLVRLAAEVGGNLDVLVNNAGMAATGGILEGELCILRTDVSHLRIIMAVGWSESLACYAGNPDEWEKIVMLNLVRESIHRSCQF